MRRNLIQEVMDEQCEYGGLLATRAEVYRDLEELRPALHFLFIQRLMFMPPAITPARADFLTRCGATLAKVRAAERSEHSS